MEREKQENRPLATLILSALAGLTLALIGGPLRAEAASLYFNPFDGNFYRNENFSVGVFVNSDTSINAVQGTVSFPTENLEAVSVKSDENSIVDLWVRKPSFSNSGALGNVYFEGVILNPGFTGSGGRILSVIFRVKKEGLSELNFPESAVLANDGLGTNILTSNGKANFSLLPPRPVSETPQPEKLRVIEERIQEMEQKIKAVEPAGKEETGVTRFWSLLPEGLRILILIFIGLTALLLSIVVLGFIAVVLTWFWSYAWRKRHKIEHEVGSLPRKVKAAIGEIIKIFKSAEGELEGDVKYGVRQFKKDFIEAETSRSLRKTLKDYWSSILKIFRRFTTKNIRE